MISTLVITDCETTGLDPATCQAIEVGVVVWSVTHRTTVTAYSTLMRADKNEAESVNRIPASFLPNAKPAKFAWTAVKSIVDNVAVQGDAAFVAHRAAFDRSFYDPIVAERWPWICSKFDIEWPRSKPGASLVEVALAHDVPISYNHRALADCLLLVRVFERCVELGVDVGKMIERAMRPKKVYQALVSFDDREKAKTAGFSWDGATKLWTKKIVPEDLEALALDFRVKEISA